jgi:hypothetical protein
MLAGDSQSRVAKCDAVLPHTHRHSDTKVSQSFYFDRVEKPPYYLRRCSQFHVKVIWIVWTIHRIVWDAGINYTVKRKWKWLFVCSCERKNLICSRD